MAQPTMVSDNAQHTGLLPGQPCAILLQPVSHPELGEIRIDDNLFAIGRTEAPFHSYPPEIVADLSRRHARIFSESGTVYIADLDSKNGTTVNGASVQQKITRLGDGDEICFASGLCYRVRLRQVEAVAPVRAAKLASLILSPERDDLGLQPIVIARFPFLISKTDDAFARYKQDHPHQVNYLSRRHAHIFVRGGAPFIEDLGSTNGTFVNDKRLDEHAVPLCDGDVLAIGGHHFVYKVGLQQEATTLEPTVTRLEAAVRTAASGMPPAGAVARAPVSPGVSPPVSPSARAATAAALTDIDKTTFVAAAGSFLDIFCVDHGARQEDEVNRDEPQGSGTPGRSAELAPGQQGGLRGKVPLFAAELAQAFSGGERRLGQGKWWRLPALAAALLVAAVLAYLGNNPERELRDMLADGKYEQAATAAAAYLASAPEEAQMKALGTEALLKARVPSWLGLLRAGQFQRAGTALAGMKQLARHNADARSLLAELEWVGQLEQYVAARGGADQPVRDDADGAGIRRLLQQWDDDTLGHQQAFSTISSYVPEFRDQYAQALSHVRKLALVNGQRAKGGPGSGDQQQPP